jgi:hypothetical protein
VQTGEPGLPFFPLSTNVVEEGFCELRVYGFLGRWDEKADPLYAVP